MNNTAALMVRTPGVSEIIQLHVAEYEALMTRATYVDLFSASVWALMVPYLSILASVWNRVAAVSILAWGSAIGLEVMLLVIATFMADHYSIVLYLEAELHPLVTSLGIDRQFWNYQKFLAQRRPRHMPMYWEWGVSFIAVIPIGIVVWSRWKLWQR